MHDKTQRAMDALEINQIGFEVKNNGIQLIVEGNDGFIDFYPTTGNWKCRINDSETYDSGTGFSLRNLIDHILGDHRG